MFSKVATASHASLALMHFKNKSKESLTAFIYRWSEPLLQCSVISPEHCRDKFKIDLFSYKLSIEKITRRVIRKHPKSVAHAFLITKEEEKNLRILDGLSKDNVYSILEIKTSPKWYSYYHFESHDTVDGKTHIKRSKPPTKCFNCDEYHYIKDCSTPKRSNTEKPQHSDQTTHTTFSISAYIPIDMW